MSNVYAFSSLTGGTDDSYLDYFDGNDLADGDFAFGIVSGKKHNYVLDADSAATENSPYIISPDSNAGDKRWVLVAPVGPMSRVKAGRSTTQSISNATWTTVVFDDEEQDILSEYNNATGIFTAIDSGEYLIQTKIELATVACTAVDNRLIGAIYKNTGGGAALDKYGPRDEARYIGGNVVLGFLMSTVLTLSASDTIEIKINQNSGSSVNVTGSVALNWLTIDRIA